MRRRAASAVLAAATLACGLVFTTATSRAQSARDDAPAANAAANPAPDLPIPVKQVVLYSSGVGYFEHFGVIKGSGTTQLNFKADQINDILKSLVLQDLDKGRIGVITYPSQDPIAKTLRSFQIDITSNPTIADLLNQLRGAKVTLTAGAEKVSGTVLGVERKPRPVGADGGGKVIEVAFLNLISDSGIRSVSLDDVRTLSLDDKKLQEELNRALSALASARDQDKKPVKINLQGDGERRVRIGYVVETPVWKTSYRLIVGEKVAGANLGGDPKPAQTGGAAQPNTKGALQGWAIVENQTDNDWTDVQLSLVSGRPISFVQDLYQPLYVPRPVVQPELYASLRPQSYDAGMAADKPRESFNRAPANAAAAIPAKPGMAGHRELQEASKKMADGRAKQAERLSDEAEALDATTSVSSLASAAKVGELFQYTVGSVSLPRQTSAMIPVVTDAVEAEKLSIYNASVLAKNPLLGARLKNTTGKHLLQGPITVLDGGAYAGDARIDDLPPGQERLISYGVDQQILVQSQNNRQEYTIQTGSIVKGVLHLTRKIVAEQEYVAENKGEKDKTLIVEHPRRGGGWKLAAPAKADETTDTLYRFKGAVLAGKGTSLMVREELTTQEQIGVISLNDNALTSYIRTGSIPQKVRDALTKAAELRQAVTQTQREITERQNRVNQIGQEQSRLRDNMKTVAQNTEYYARLLKKLDDQEGQIETLQKEITGLRAKQDEQRKTLEDFLNGLNVS